MRYFAPFLGLLLFSAAAVTEPATAQPNRARQGVQSGEVRSLDEILNGIRRERPGSLADVEGPSMGPYGEPHYRLKWLTPDGRVLWLDTDARTGRVLGVQGDDRGPGAAPPPRQQQPRGAPNFGPRPNAFGGQPGGPPQFGQPGGPPSRFRPPPREGFRGGPDGRFGGPPPPPEFRGGPPPDRGGPPPNFRRGPPPQDLDGPPPPRPRGGFGREPQARPRGNFNQGGGDGFRRPPGPEGQPRGPRRFR